MTKSVSSIQPARAGDILRSLIGTWTIERRVDDQATMTGSADFESSGIDEAVYHEKGTLRLATGYETAAERKYVYQKRPTGFAVFFDEKPLRLFHEVRLTCDADGCLRGEAKHLCGHDLYLTDYEFDSDTHFRIRHRVRGPRKDYTMTTTYRKIARAER